MTEIVALPALALPRPPDMHIRQAKRGSLVLDPVRRRYVRLTPEEWVRQHVLYLMTSQLEVPIGLTTVEQAFTWNKQVRRADIVAYKQDGSAWMVVECKAPDVSISQRAFDQVARYNTVLQAKHVAVTNGSVFHAAAIEADQIRYLDTFPIYSID